MFLVGERGDFSKILLASTGEKDAEDKNTQVKDRNDDKPGNCVIHMHV